MHILALSLKTIFVEYTGVSWVRVFNTKYPMAPSIFDNSVSLSEKYLLCFHCIKIVKLSLYIFKFSTSLSRTAKVSWVDQELTLGILKFFNFLSNGGKMLLSFSLIVKRLPMLVLHCGHWFSLLKWRRAVILIYVYWLSLCLSVQTYKSHTWADHRWAERVWYSLFMARPPGIVNVRHTSLVCGRLGLWAILRCQKLI